MSIYVASAEDRFSANEPEEIMSTDTEKPGCSYCGFTNQSPYRSDGKTIACDSCFERWRFMGPDAARAKWIIITSRKDFGSMGQATAESQPCELRVDGKISAGCSDEDELPPIGYYVTHRESDWKALVKSVKGESK